MVYPFEFERKLAMRNALFLISFAIGLQPGLSQAMDTPEQEAPKKAMLYCPSGQEVSAAFKDEMPSKTPIMVKGFSWDVNNNNSAAGNPPIDTRTAPLGFNSADIYDNALTCNYLNRNNPGEVLSLTRAQSDVKASLAQCEVTGDQRFHVSKMQNANAQVMPGSGPTVTFVGLGYQLSCPPDESINITCVPGSKE